MEFLDLTNMNFYYSLAVGGGMLALLAMFSYSMGGAKVQVPSVVIATVGGLGAGLALGVILMGFLGYRPKEALPPEPGSADDPRRRMAAGGPAPGMGMPGRGATTSAKLELANLVGKIYLLTGNQLTLKLNDEQRQKVRKQLAGLDKLEDLGEEDAQKRIDALLAALEADREALNAVNYRWSPPSDAPPGLGGPAPPPANPFREGASRKQLQSLEKQLESKAGDTKGS